MTSRLANTVTIGNRFATQDPEFITATGKPLKLNGVILDPGSTPSDPTVAKSNQFVLENPMTSSDARSVLFQQTADSTNLKISTKSGTGSGIISLEADGQSVNKLEVFSGGATCTGTLSSVGPVQIGNKDSGGNNIFSTLTPTIVGTDCNLAINTSGANSQLALTHNGTVSTTMESTGVTFSQPTNHRQQIRVGSISEEALITPLSGGGISIGSNGNTPIQLNSEGELELVSNNPTTTSNIKLKTGSTNRLDITPGSVTLGAEGTNQLNRLCGKTHICESNTVDAQSRETIMEMGTSSSNFALTTKNSGQIALLGGNIVSNEDITNSKTHTVANPLDNTSTTASLYSDLRLFNAVANMYTTYINIFEIQPRKQTGGDLGTPTAQDTCEFIVVNSGTNSPGAGQLNTRFYPFINNTQIAAPGPNTTAGGVALYDLAERGISGVEIFCKFLRANPWTAQKNWNGQGTPPTAPNLTQDILKDSLFPHFKTEGVTPVPGAGNVTSNVIDNWCFQFNFNIPNNNGTGNVLFDSETQIPVTHSYESIARFNASGGATSAYLGDLPTVNYFADASTDITGINFKIPYDATTARFNQDVNLLESAFLLTQVRVLSKYVGTTLS